MSIRFQAQVFRVQHRWSRITSHVALLRTIHVETTFRCCDLLGAYKLNILEDKGDEINTTELVGAQPLQDGRAHALGNVESLRTKDVQARPGLARSRSADFAKLVSCPTTLRSVFMPLRQRPSPAPSGAH